MYVYSAEIPGKFVAHGQHGAQASGQFFVSLRWWLVDSFHGCVRGMGLVVKSRKETGLELRLKTFDFVFGCHHLHLSRVLQTRRKIYRVCCDCGARFDYFLAAALPAYASIGETYEKRNLLRAPLRSHAVGTG